MSDTFDESYVPGDHACNVCYGVAYYDAAMKAKKTPFSCYGLRAIEEDVVPQALIEYEEKSTSVFDSYMCIGKSMTSGRMDRLCKAPVRINGVEFVTVIRSDPIGAKRERILEQRNKMLRERKLTYEEKDAGASTDSQEKP